MDETTVLPVGSHQLTAFADGTDRFDPAEPVTETITVNPKVEEEKYPGHGRPAGGRDRDVHATVRDV